MSIPLVTVLWYACDWGINSTTASVASEAVTWGLWQNGFYDPGATVVNNMTNSGETFYPNMFMALNFVGQCADFADFLTCLSNSLGAQPLQSLRSRLISEVQTDQDDQFETTPFWSVEGLPPLGKGSNLTLRFTSLRPWVGQVSGTQYRNQIIFCQSIIL